ncbi:MAG TPA: hypothetical protein VMT88_11465 [Actinomycetes bacterium]|nr:hypothetical protein [Actinomycetes bacterium]
MTDDVADDQLVAQSLTRVSWMAWLFVIGSACFAVGVPLSLRDSADPVVAAVVFFVGSIFFTAASSIQMWLAHDTLSPSSSTNGLGAKLRALFDVRNPAWTSAVVQWFGTLFFNVTTFRSVLDAVDAGSVSNNLVWFPDAFGSVLFLVSSAIACMPEVRAHRHGHARDRSWVIVMLNMLGSVFFGLSAVGAYTLPTDDELVNVSWANGGTLLGALCFLVGAWLVAPRHADAERQISAAGGVD